MQTTAVDFSQERDRTKIPDQYKWDLTADLSLDGSVAQREG